MNNSIAVVGGVYRETNLTGSHEIFGSGGRAALAISSMNCQVDLYSYFNNYSLNVMQSHADFNGMKIYPRMINDVVSFHYQHWLDIPNISGLTINTPIKVKAKNVIRYGMMEGDAIVDAEYAVYDPQNPGAPVSFEQNGSKAKHLAIVLNIYEARALAELDGSHEEMARAIFKKNHAEVVIIKLGAQGAMAFERGNVTFAAAYNTNHVWKIGSGDIFVAHFGFQWMRERLPASEAIKLASLATAKYCESGNIPSIMQLEKFNPSPVLVSERYLNGYQPKVYIAGPFFTLAQLWIVEQARNNLLDMGMKVFSPYHDVGHGSAEDVVKLDIEAIEDCDVLLAIADGLDSGTIYEIGYARAKNKPVVVYAENVSQEDKKMMEGSSCTLCYDYVSAIYKVVWAGMSN